MLLVVGVLLAAACATTKRLVVIPDAVFDGCFRAHFKGDEQPADDGIYCPDKRAFFLEDPELSAREHAEEALLRMEVLLGLSQGALPLTAIDDPEGWRAAHPHGGGVDVFELSPAGGDVALFCTWDHRDDGWCRTLAMLLDQEGTRGFLGRAQARPARPDVVLDRMRWSRQCARGSDQACEALQLSCRAAPEREGCTASDGG